MSSRILESLTAREPSDVKCARVMVPRERDADGCWQAQTCKVWMVNACNPDLVRVGLNQVPATRGDLVVGLTGSLRFCIGEEGNLLPLIGKLEGGLALAEAQRAMMSACKPVQDDYGLDLDAFAPLLLRA